MKSQVVLISTIRVAICSLCVPTGSFFMAGRMGAVWSSLLKMVALVVACVISGCVGAALSKNIGSSSYTLSYADFISILLTAVSLLMTVLAIFLAIAGFLGWTTIEQKVRSKAEDYLAEGFSQDGHLLRMLGLRIEEAANAKFTVLTAELRVQALEQIKRETANMMMDGVQEVSPGIEEEGGGEA